MKEEAELKRQEALFTQYQQICDAYTQADLPYIPLTFPTSAQKLTVYQERFLFFEKWNRQITKDKAMILPYYHKKISFPTPPYETEAITHYVKSVRPYLQRSRIVKVHLPICCSAMILLSLFWFSMT